MMRPLLAQAAHERLRVEEIKEALLVVLVEIRPHVTAQCELDSRRLLQDALGRNVVREERRYHVTAQIDRMNGVEHLVDMAERLVELHLLLGAAVEREVHRHDAERRTPLRLGDELDGRAHIAALVRVEEDFLLPRTARRLDERAELVIEDVVGLIHGLHGLVKAVIADGSELLAARFVRIVAAEALAVVLENR